ncbi:MAG: hypothetical protein HONBIEJF_02958 [Fimbriimonadaceae bacterium]|nr:hypothetical protein [Fimbriimonadaceae bacterium]
MKKLLFVALLVTPCLLLASPDIKINAKRLPKGLTVAKAKSLVAKSSAAMLAKSKAESKAEQARIKRAWDKLAPIRQALKSQEKSNAAYGSFIRQAKSLMTSKRKDRLDRVRQLLKKNRSVIDSAYHFGGADKDKVRDLLRNVYGIDYTYLELIGLQLRKLLEASQEPPLPATQTFNPPYAFHASDISKSGAGFNNASVTFNDSSGRMRLSCDSLATGFPALASANATEGIFIDVPSNARRMTITLHFNFSYKTTTTAVAGGALVSALGVFRTHVAGVSTNNFVATSLFNESNNALVVGGQELSVPTQSGSVTLTRDVSGGQRFEAAVDLRVSTNAQGFSGGAASIDFTATSYEVTFEE